MVDVSVREKHILYLAGIERKLVEIMSSILLTLKHPAVDKNPVMTGIKMIARPGDHLRCSAKLQNHVGQLQIILS
jgi:hypothetical protein